MPVVKGAVHRNSYRDSVELMGIAAQLEQRTGIQRAGLVMATPANLAVLAEAGLADAAAGGPGPNDLVVAVAAADEASADQALAAAATLLAAGTGDADGTTEMRTAQTLGEGLAELPDANLALVSTPGTYASAEALRALEARPERLPVQRQRSDRGRDPAQDAGGREGSPGHGTGLRYGDRRRRPARVRECRPTRADRASSALRAPASSR